MDKSQTDAMTRKPGEIAGAMPPADNGWQRVSVWQGGQTTGDYTVGEEFTAYYELTGTDWRAEHTYWITAQGERDGRTWELEYGEDADAENVRYAVDERTEIFREADGDQLDLETTYGDGSYLFYPTVQKANAEGERLALMNFAWDFGPRELFEKITKEGAAA